MTTTTFTVACERNILGCEQQELLRYVCRREAATVTGQFAVEKKDWCVDVFTKIRNTQQHTPVVEIHRLTPREQKIMLCRAWEQDYHVLTYDQ